MSHEQRFVLPYKHTFFSSQRMLTLRQAAFSAEGFASTIWDSAIVVRTLESNPRPAHAALERTLEPSPRRAAETARSLD